MKIVNHTQGSNAWLQWRSKGLTASEAAIIVGQSPYKTPWRLWAERTGIARADDLSKNPLVQRGHRLEPVARDWFQQKVGGTVVPMCAESDEEPLIRASFDGIWTRPGRLESIPVELKVPHPATFREIVAIRRASAAYKLYTWQVQQQMYVAGAEIGYLVFYPDDQGKTPVVFKIHRDEVVIKEILDKSMAFYRLLQSGKEPEKDPSRDLYVPAMAADPAEAQIWRALAARYQAADERMKALKADTETVKAELDDLQSQMVGLMINADALLAESDGVSVTRFMVKGSVDWKKLVEEHLPGKDTAFTDGYRKAPSERVRVTVKMEERATIPFSPDQVKDVLNIDGVESWYF